jgi:hypothetical protein
MLKNFFDGLHGQFFPSDLQDGANHGSDHILEKAGGLNRVMDFIARVTFHIPDKGQVTVRYYGLYANARRGKARVSPFVLRMAEEEAKPVPSKGWAAMIRKVYEVDPMVCPKCGGTMKVVAFITDYQAIDRIIDHLKLTFAAEKPPPLRVFVEVALMAAEGLAEYS